MRLSDFKTNEYANLVAGADFEPREENPMLGFRGAARYAHPAYAAGFALECAALRRVRDVMGLTNLKIMIPFCRRVEEARNVIEAMAQHGLKRGEGGLEIFMMCEIPNNVILIDQFARLFDGFSIGSNDLTQLTLGVDRDSEIVAFDFDERDPGMLQMLTMAVTGAKRNHRHVGICGEAPANYPEIARFLTGLGIDSISVNPSSILRTMAIVREAEFELAKSQSRRRRCSGQLICARLSHIIALASVRSYYCRFCFCRAHGDPSTLLELHHPPMHPERNAPRPSACWVRRISLAVEEATFCCFFTISSLISNT